MTNDPFDKLARSIESLGIIDYQLMMEFVGRQSEIAQIRTELIELQRQMKQELTELKREVYGR